MQKKRDKIIQQILSIIIQQSHPDKVILFGSQATGTYSIDSDYDFIIIKRNIKNERTVTRPIYRAFYEQKIQVPVDVIAIDSEKWENQKNNKNMIYHNAYKEGVVLYG